MPDPILLTITPRGSTIEALGNNHYRVCDRGHHCRQVQGLWQAQELVHEAELHHRAINNGPGGCAG